MEANAVVDLDCNVHVKILNQHGQVIRTINKHNKATVNLVDGILRFLKGDFNITDYNNAVTPEQAIIYLPVRAGFGRIGVKLTEGATAADRRFDFVDSTEFVVPTFDSTQLQEPIDFKDYTLLKFEKVRQAGYVDNNNAECLEFTLYINPGKLVGYLEDQGDDGNVFVPYPWSYYNPSTGEYEVMLTEAGLFSSSNVLLARVLFDGDVVQNTFYDSEGISQGTYPSFADPNSEDNPIVQSETTTIVLIWRIGIVSVGKNDDYVTEASPTTQDFINQLTEWFINYITEVTGVEQDDWKDGYTRPRVRNDISTEINTLLNNSTISNLTTEEEGN